MNDQEKEIQKYKEQGRGTKKKGQIAAEPEKYKIDETKMIGTPDMLSSDEKTRYTISAMARKFGTIGILAVIIGPLGSLLSLGAAEMLSEGGASEAQSKTSEDIFHATSETARHSKGPGGVRRSDHGLRVGPHGAGLSGLDVHIISPRMYILYKIN